MSLIGERLREARVKRGLTQAEVAERLGVTRSVIARYESGINDPPSENISKMAEILGVSADYLLGRTHDPRPISSIEQLLPEAIPLDKLRLVAIPIYGEIRAGEPMFANEEILGYEYVLEDEVKNGDYFFLLVKGDSMINARICEGDLVLVRKQNWLENGNIGVFIVNGEEATIKRYYEQDDLIILKPENTAYSPQVYRPEEVIILGKVVQLRAKF